MGEEVKSFLNIITSFVDLLNILDPFFVGFSEYQIYRESPR